jgi:hypothetical protein
MKLWISPGLVLQNQLDAAVRHTCIPDILDFLASWERGRMGVRERAAQTSAVEAGCRCAGALAHALR